MSWKPVLLIILQMLPALSRCWAAGQAAEQQGSLKPWFHCELRLGSARSAFLSTKICVEFDLFRY